MSRLEGHTTAILRDHLTDEVRSTEAWTMPFGDAEVGGTLVVYRLKTEGTEDDHDELVVKANADSASATWEYLWSSDPEYPFAATDTSHQRVFSKLPNDICDLIETETGLDMEEARP